MLLKVIRQTMNGKRLEEAVPELATLNRVFPTVEDASFPMLRFIDPFGDTIFSSHQMLGFLPVWIDCARPGRGWAGHGAASKW